MHDHKAKNKTKIYIESETYTQSITQDIHTNMHRLQQELAVVHNYVCTTDYE